MKKIIALIDGSSYAQSVCDYASWVAQQGEASLVLLHVLGRRDGSTDNADLSGSIGLGARTALLEELAEIDGQKARLANKRGRAILEDAKARVEQQGVTRVSTTLRNGQLIETMHEFEADADLIVIGKRGEASNFDMEHLGSNLERVVRSTKKPVLVAARAYKPVAKMLIAFDGGKSAMRAVEHIATSRVFTGIDCLLLHVGSESSSYRKQLGGAVATLQQAGFQAEYRVVAGQADRVIADTVESEQFDLLVMGAYGHSRIRNLIIGSTTTQMIGACKVPVMLFR
jgi:nucleotide-binding universal stress UspA family protein